jgi:glycosyltransferase involved in cell wall biosynthesis
MHQNPDKGSSGFEPKLATGYSVLIRTFNSEKTIRQTLDSLGNQSLAPSEYVIVDSGSTDKTLEMLPTSSIVHRYIGKSFNYSDALNQGTRLVGREFTLIVSSHTSLLNKDALEYANCLLRENDNIGGVYFLPGEEVKMSYELISAQNFTGFNGIFNTCALVKTEALKKRDFRPEVFAAEDQEWSRWLLEVEQKSIARISGAGMIYSNQIKDRRMKDLYEDLAVAIYVKPNMFSTRYLLRIAYRILRPVSRWKMRCHNLRLLKSLVYYRIVGIPDTIDIFAKR